MKEFLKKNKKAALIGGVLLTGALAYYLFRSRKIEFYDNVWCGEDNNECLDIDVATYGSGQRAGLRSGGNGSGNLNLLFKEKHELEEGDVIYITQNKNQAYDYDGKANVQKVITPYIIRTDKARMGDSPIVGGYVSANSKWSEIVS
jgi:hypothetical protein